VNEKKKVLVIDDDSVVRDLISRVVQRNGAEALALSNPDDVRKVLKIGTLFSIIVIDLVMPGECGWDLIDQIRSTPSFSNTPIIVFTGLTLSEKEKKMLAGKVAAVVMKNDFDLASFQKLLNNYL
jgi:CheY-like chemotaxis protein